MFIYIYIIYMCIYVGVYKYLFMYINDIHIVCFPVNMQFGLIYSLLYSFMIGLKSAKIVLYLSYVLTIH